MLDVCQRAAVVTRENRRGLADVALAGYRGLMANKRAVLPGLGVKIVPFLLRLFPRGFILAAVGKLQLKR